MEPQTYDGDNRPTSMPDPAPARVVRAPAPAPPETSDDATLTGEAEVGIFAERRPDLDVASVSPLLRLGIRPRPQVEIFGGFGAVATFSDGPEGRENFARPSNIDFGGRWVRRWGGDRYRSASIGFQFAIPTGAVQSDAQADAYEYALGGRAGWNPWDWTPATLGLVVPAEIHAQVWRRLVVGGELGVGGMFPSIDNNAPPSAAAQVAAQARYVLPWLGVGVRVSGVYNGQRREDTTQTAVAPFADVSLCRRGGPRLRGTLERANAKCPAYLSARFNINLDAPYGWATKDAMRVWGLQLGLGWSVF